MKALDSTTTLEDFSKSTFIKKFAFRRNITFFDQERIPEKQVIEKIIQDSYKYVPILNCVYPFRIKIWGPEHRDMKKQMVLRSICGTNQHDFRPGGKYVGDWKKCEQIYDEWIKLIYRLGKPTEFDGYYFNNQIIAPYLISFSSYLSLILSFSIFCPPFLLSFFLCPPFFLSFFSSFLPFFLSFEGFFLGVF